MEAPWEKYTNFHAGPALSQGFPPADQSSFIILNGGKGMGGGSCGGLLEFYGALCFIFTQLVCRDRAKRIAKGISSAVVEGSVRAWGSIAALGGSSAALGLSSAAGKSEAISFRRLTQTTEGSPSDLPWEQRRSQGFFLW